MTPACISSPCSSTGLPGITLTYSLAQVLLFETGTAGSSSRTAPYHGSVLALMALSHTENLQPDVPNVKQLPVGWSDLLEAPELPLSRFRLAECTEFQETKLGG